MQLATFLSALLAAIAAAGDTQPALAPNGHAVLAPRHTPADRQRGGLHRRAPPDEFLKWIRETKERKAAQLESDAPAEQQRRREQREFEDRERKEYDVRLAKEPRVEGRVGFDRDDPQRARPLSRDDNRWCTQCYRKWRDYAHARTCTDRYGKKGQYMCIDGHGSRYCTEKKPKPIKLTYVGR